MSYTDRIPALLLVLLVFLGAWYYAATLKSAPNRSTDSVGPKASGEPSSMARGLRPPRRAPQILADPFVPPAPPAQTKKEALPLVLPALPPPPPQTGNKHHPPALPPRSPIPATTQPAPATAPAAAVEPVGPPFKLSGVVLGDVPVAILAGINRPYVAMVGDEVEGWRVMRITETDVTLRSPSGEQVSLTR
jgi:hypothetical protein